MKFLMVGVVGDRVEVEVPPEMCHGKECRFSNYCDGAPSLCSASWHHGYVILHAKNNTKWRKFDGIIKFIKRDSQLDE